jgi:hypothetical protein
MEHDTHRCVYKHLQMISVRDQMNPLHNLLTGFFPYIFVLPNFVTCVFRLRLDGILKSSISEIAKYRLLVVTLKCCYLI